MTHCFHKMSVRIKWLFVAAIAVMVVYDMFCVLVLVWCVNWIEEWFSVRQKQIERILIVCFACGGLLPLVFRLRGVDLINGGFVLLIVCFMWQLQRMQEGGRGRVWLTSLRCGLLRLCLQLLCGVIFVCLLGARGSLFWITALLLFRQVAICLFFYLICFGSAGKLGKRRKLAWEEIKKIFGTDWIPKPLTVPR